ncbi:MAG: hypothetical protein WCF58_03755 [Syntrophobacteraceae bacterium]
MAGLDEILGAIIKSRKFGENLAVDQLMTRARSAAATPAPKSPEPDYLRGLEAIGKYICKDKPVSPKTLRVLIRKRKLPAAKVYGIGWIAKVERLKAWLEEMTAENT